MAWQVIEYMDNNPQATPKDVIGYFATTMEIDKQLDYLNSEVEKVLEIREKLRPLYGKKMNVETNMALLGSEFDMEVMAKYPPRQGTDKDRKAYRSKLQSEHSGYQELLKDLAGYKEEIEDLEMKMADLQQNAKNGRRILETFNHYMAFVLNVNVASAAVTPSRDPFNANVF